MRPPPPLPVFRRPFFEALSSIIQRFYAGRDQKPALDPPEPLIRHRCAEVRFRLHQPSESLPVCRFNPMGAGLGLRHAGKVELTASHVVHQHRRTAGSLLGVSCAIQGCALGRVVQEQDAGASLGADMLKNAQKAGHLASAVLVAAVETAQGVDNDQTLTLGHALD